MDWLLEIIWLSDILDILIWIIAGSLLAIYNGRVNKGDDK